MPKMTIDTDDNFTPAERQMYHLTVKSAFLRAADIIEKITQEDVAEAQLEMHRQGVSLANLAKDRPGNHWRGAFADYCGRDEMTVSTIRVTCGDCKKVFDAEVVTDCPVSVAISSMEAVRCPECYSANCGLGGNYDDAPPVAAPIADRVRWWKDRGEHGISSETIFSAFTGAYAKRTATPRDPDDFRRCQLLLDLIPEWRADLGTVSKAYPWFAPMVEKWGEIEALYATEAARKWKGEHVCYALMQTVQGEGRW